MEQRKSPASVSWERTSGPEYELLTTAEARRHLRLESYGGDEDAAEDSYINELIVAAGEVIETHTNRPVRAQGRRLYVAVDESVYGDERRGEGPWWVYWDSGLIRLNATPIREVTALRWIDDGVEREMTLSGGDFVVTGASGGINRHVDIRPGGDGGGTWPWRLRTRDDDTDIRVEVECGWLQADLPQAIKHATRILVNDLYAHRSEVVVGASVAKVPRSVNALLMPYVRQVFR